MWSHAHAAVDTLTYINLLPSGKARFVSFEIIKPLIRHPAQVSRRTDYLKTQNDTNMFLVLH